MHSFLRMSVVVAVVLSAASGVSAQGQVPGVHLCIGPNGFTIVKPGVECPEGETMSRLPALKVKDAKNRQVGDFESMGSTYVYPQVLMRSGEKIFLVTVTTNRLEGSNELYYESEDCTGTPFFGDVTLDGLLTQTAIINGSGTQTVYVPDLTAMQSRTSRSRLLRGGRCEQTLERTRDLYPLTLLTTLTFTPPFRVE